MSIAGLGTGLLGQISDVASAPRRALWSMMGLPEEGTEAVSQILGMDPASPWTQALGFGAEVLGDPLNLLGMPMAGRLGSLASRLGPKYQGLLAKAGAAGEGFGAADKALDLERAAMGNRFQDIADIGQGAKMQAEMDVAGRAARARDAMVPPFGNESYPRKLMATDDPRLRTMQAYGLSDDVGGRTLAGIQSGMGEQDAAIAAIHGTKEGYENVVPGLMPARQMPSGRMSGRHVGFADVPEYLSPPNDYPAMYGPRGFGPNTQSGYMTMLDARQEQAKNALIEALQGLQGYDIPALSGLEQLMMAGGAGSMAMPIGRELGR